MALVSAASVPMVMSSATTFYMIWRLGRRAPVLVSRMLGCATIDRAMSRSARRALDLAGRNDGDAPMPSHWQQTWLEAQQHVLAGRLDAARAALSSLLDHDPTQVNARLLLASVMLAQGRVRDAAEQVKFAAFTLPGDPDLICKVAQSLSSLGETNAARACLRHPEVARTRSGPALAALAHIQQGLGLHAQALELMDRARAAGFDTPDFRYFRALQLQFNGRLADAEAELESCLRLGPTFGRASLTLARMRRQTPADNHVDFIRARLATVAPGTEDHAAFEFALHKELDDLGELDDAWAALVRGNAVMHGRVGYDAAAETRLFDQLIAAFDANLPARDGVRHSGPMPIFIVGLPRSGTTLLERILGSHSMVASAGELTDLPRQLRWVADQHGHALLDERLLAGLDRFDFAALGRRYLEQSQWRADGRPYYIDKLPPNFMLLGHIRRALPLAKVVHIRREPMDVCFSNYRALFGDAYAYSYDMPSLAHHHGQYQRLMQHWRGVMPDFVLDLPYADLVRDTAATCATLLDFCGLPFEAACLDHTGNRNSVATLSSAQVREPIHARGLGEWQRYQRQLQPLRELLDRDAPLASRSAA
jgi:tetratricopeptide (TPR) repeat protein